MYYGRRSKTNDHTRCRFCGCSVLTRRIKGTKDIVILSPAKYNFLLKESGADKFYYNGKMNRGVEVCDGLIGYKEHKCYFKK